MLQAKRMGRKPAAEKKLSNVEKQKRYLEKNKEILKEKKKKKQRKVYEGLPTITQGKRETRVKKKKRKESKKVQQTRLMRNHWLSI